MNKAATKDFQPPADVVAYEVALFEAKTHNAIFQNRTATAQEINVILRDRFAMPRWRRRVFVGETWERGTNSVVAKGVDGTKYSFIAVKGAS